MRTTVEHLDGTDDIGWLEQMPIRVRLLRAGPHRHRVHMVLGHLKFPKGTEHV